MKIILLSGKPGTGKSQTFNLLYEKIVNDENTEIISEKERLGNPRNKDFECVVIYKGKKVAMYSMGDYPNKCVEAIIKFSNYDVLILAYSEERHCIIKKSEAESKADELKTNEKDCEQIIEELNLFIR